MAAVVAMSNCSFSVLTSTVKLRCSVSARRRFTTLRGSVRSVAPKAADQRKRVSHSRKGSLSSSSSDKSNRERDFVSEKEFRSKSKDESAYLYANGCKGGGDIRKPQTTAYKPFGMQRKEKREFMSDSKEQQVEPGNFQDAAFLNAVVKVYCTHTAPDYSLPWQKQRQYTSTGSAFMIGDGKLLTNAHCVEHETQVKVKRRGDDTKYVAKDSVTVVGYPLGGDTISVTKGVVSRIEVTSYAHGSSDLLGIQIDAAINPGNSGGPAFNDQGECIGVAFQVYRSEEAENIGYVIPTTVVSHFLNDYERNKKYTGFPCLGVLLQKLENPALRECLKVKSSEGVLVRRIEPTSDVHNVLKKGDVIVSFDDVHVGCEGTVPFRSNERIAFRYLISQKFAGDIAELGIIRAGEFMKVKVVLNPRVHLVPYHIDGGQPSYLIIAGLVFTPLSEPLIEEECEDSIGLKLLAKARYSLARFKGEQIVILSQVLANEVNIGYEDMSNQQVLKLNGTRIKNIHHLAHLVDSCKDKYLAFEFEDNYVAVLEREAAITASSCILKDYGIPSERSADLLEPFVDSLGDNQASDQDYGDSPVSNFEIGFDGIIWA
ncbi:protease Do-like 2, chloroplastic isoform X2 [Morus notabilis]|uniref:protease Do-like 2, chloroplastic isoform X2 n=1 Tax=Morus notabilis TaxID=981085 RepID=UPI000CED7766|nr:protease Do-like 2, chloroplastic isoform X2 [Morus notabilis]